MTSTISPRTSMQSTSAGSRLERLPTDVLGEVVDRLSVQDGVVLSQTSRAMHAVVQAKRQQQSYWQKKAADELGVTIVANAPERAAQEYKDSLERSCARKMFTDGVTLNVHAFIPESIALERQRLSTLIAHEEPHAQYSSLKAVRATAASALQTAVTVPLAAYAGGVGGLGAAAFTTGWAGSSVASTVVTAAGGSDEMRFTAAMTGALAGASASLCLASTISSACAVAGAGAAALIGAGTTALTPVLLLREARRARTNIAHWEHSLAKIDELEKRVERHHERFTAIPSSTATPEQSS